MVIFPYYSHIFRDSYGSGMGILWVPLTIRGSHYWGSLKIPLIQVGSIFQPAMLVFPPENYRRKPEGEHQSFKIFWSGTHQSKVKLINSSAALFGWNCHELRVFQDVIFIRRCVINWWAFQPTETTITNNQQAKVQWSTVRLTQHLTNDSDETWWNKQILNNPWICSGG